MVKEPPSEPERRAILDRVLLAYASAIPKPYSDENWVHFVGDRSVYHHSAPGKKQNLLPGQYMQGIVAHPENPMDATHVILSLPTKIPVMITSGHHNDSARLRSVKGLGDLGPHNRVLSGALHERYQLGNDDFTVLGVVGGVGGTGWTNLPGGLVSPPPLDDGNTEIAVVLTRKAHKTLARQALEKLADPVIGAGLKHMNEAEYKTAFTPDQDPNHKLKRLVSAIITNAGFDTSDKPALDEIARLAGQKENNQFGFLLTTMIQRLPRPSSHAAATRQNGDHPEERGRG